MSEEKTVRMFSTLVIAIAFLYIGSTEAGTLIESNDYSESKISFNFPMQETTKLVYARCNASQPGLAKRCIVRLQLNAFDTSKITTKECEVVLKPEMPNGLVKDVLTVADFGKDKVIVVWLETQNTSDSKNQILKTSVIRMFDNCQTFETKVRKYSGNAPDEHKCKYLSLVAFESNYEIVLYNNCTSKSECSSTFSHYKFDAHGKLTSGPEHWPDQPVVEKSGYNLVIPVDSRKPAKGYFNLNRNDTYLQADLIVKKGDNYHKQTLWKAEPSEKDFMFTATNEAIGFCYEYKNSSYECWQADQEGRICLQKTFNFETPHKAHISNVYNTRNGEILNTAEIKCSDDSCNAAGDRFYFMKISIDGSIKTLEIQCDTKCESCTDTRIFENEFGQYCVGRICSSKLNEPVHVDTSMRCYSKEAFSK